MKVNSQQTLAHRLCAEDPDLKCPEHDKMSFMLAMPETWRKLLRREMMPDVPGEAEFWLGKICLEYPITKGSGQYQTVIGFADAKCTVNVEIQDEHSRLFRGWNNETWCGTTATARLSKAVIVEAKPKIANPMETLRQLNTYRNFIDAIFLLWCPTIEEKTKTVFLSQGIFVSTIPVDIQ